MLDALVFFFSVTGFGEVCRLVLCALEVGRKLPHVPLVAIDDFDDRDAAVPMLPFSFCSCAGLHLVTPVPHFGVWKWGGFTPFENVYTI